MKNHLSLDFNFFHPFEQIVETYSLLYQLYYPKYDYYLKLNKIVIESQNDPSLKIFKQSFEGRGPEINIRNEESKEIPAIKDRIHIKREKEKLDDDRELINDLFTLIAQTFDQKLDSKNVKIKRLLEHLKNSSNSLEKGGKLLWALDNEPDQVFEKLINKSASQICEWIDLLFDEKMDELVESLKYAVDREHKLGIQSAYGIINTQIPVEIAKLLITRTGALNIGLITSMRHLFTGDRDIVLNHDKSLKQTLELFLTSPSLRNLFDSIEAPGIPHSRITTILRIILGVQPDVPLNSVDAKRAVMAALLSHLRQYTSRSCFAAFLAIQLKQSYLESCLKDLISLLKDGHLSRNIDGIKRNFPFLMKMNNPYLFQKFELMPDGQIFQDGKAVGNIIESSGLHATSVAMGFENSEKTLLHIARDNHGMVTPNDIIEKLAHLRAFESGQKAFTGKYYHEGCFAFGSKILNPLLKIWVNTIAGMAEGQANCFFSSLLIKSVFKVFQKNIKEDPHSQNEAIEIIEKNICKHLAESIRYMYDPAISFTNSLDEGGFVLYESYSEGTRLKRIDDAQKFQDFLLRILEVSLIACTSCEKTVNQLKKFVKSEDFIKKALATYKTTLREAYDGVSSDDEVTPWINLFGHNAGAIIRVYFENKKKFKSYNIHSKNGFHLLKKLLEIKKHLSKMELQRISQNPNILKPVRVLNYHAFSLILGHESLKDAWKKETDIKKWRYKKIINPGRKIAASPMLEKQRQDLYNGLKKIFPKLKLKNLPKEISIKEFRNQLIKMLPDKSPSVKRLVDQKIVQTLTPEMKQEFKKTLIHFADTNFHSETHDIHFCFLVNPGTGKVEVWQVNDDGSQLKPFDQRDITMNKTWEVYLHPEKSLR